MSHVMPGETGERADALPLRGQRSSASASASASRACWRTAMARDSSPNDEIASSALNSRHITSIDPAPSRAIAVKASSTSDEASSAGTCTRGWRGGAVGEAGRVWHHRSKTRTSRPTTSMAVPGSFIAGDSARPAISESTTSPKRGSPSNVRARPMV